mgnify:CR=1 FL=1
MVMVMVHGTSTTKTADAVTIPMTPPLTEPWHGGVAKRMRRGPLSQVVVACLLLIKAIHGHTLVAEGRASSVLKRSDSTTGFLRVCIVCVHMYIGHGRHCSALKAVVAVHMDSCCDARGNNKGERPC